MYANSVHEERSEKRRVLAIQRSRRDTLPDRWTRDRSRAFGKVDPDAFPVRGRCRLARPKSWLGNETINKLAATVLFALLAITTATAADEGPVASGSLAWFSSDRYDLIGTMAAEIPLASPGGWLLSARAGLLTGIEKATD